MTQGEKEMGDDGELNLENKKEDPSVRVKKDRLRRAAASIGINVEFAMTFWRVLKWMNQIEW